MKNVAKLLLIWGMLDSMLLATKPEWWSKFWGKAVDKIGKEKKVARAISGVQFALCAWFWKKL
jgi:hypothetical protein